MMSLYGKLDGTYAMESDGIYYLDIVSIGEKLHYRKYGRMRLRFMKENVQRYIHLSVRKSYSSIFIAVDDEDIREWGSGVAYDAETENYRRFKKHELGM